MRSFWLVLAGPLLVTGCLADGETAEAGQNIGVDLGPAGDATATETASEALMCLDTALGGDCNLVPTEVTGGCFVTGIGHIGDENNHPGAGRAGEDSFGGNAMGMKDGTVRGQWQNTTHQGDLFHGQATWLRCWKDDGEGPQVPRAIPNNAEWGGPGLWNHEEGYTFRVHAADRREGGHHADEYEIFVFGPDGELVYSESEIIDGGNFQIHPPNNGHPYETTYQPGPGDAEYDYFVL